MQVVASMAEWCHAPPRFNHKSSGFREDGMALLNKIEFGRIRAAEMYLPLQSYTVS